MNNDRFDSMFDLAQSLDNGVVEIQVGQVARILKVYYDAYVEQGFTEPQAFSLVQTMLHGAV